MTELMLQKSEMDQFSPLCCLEFYNIIIITQGQFISSPRVIAKILYHRRVLTFFFFFFLIRSNIYLHRKNLKIYIFFKVGIHIYKYA